MTVRLLICVGFVLGVLLLPIAAWGDTIKLAGGATLAPLSEPAISFPADSHLVLFPLSSGWSDKLAIALTRPLSTGVHLSVVDVSGPASTEAFDTAILSGTASNKITGVNLGFFEPGDRVTPILLSKPSKVATWEAATMPALGDLNRYSIVGTPYVLLGRAGQPAESAWSKNQWIAVLQVVPVPAVVPPPPPVTPPSPPVVPTPAAFSGGIGLLALLWAVRRRGRRSH